MVARFIPTRVGNAWPMTRAKMRSPVHPHARGERAEDAFEGITEAGSSPRVWGTLIDQAARDAKDRFIPTRVGNATRLGCICVCGTVHPHARGERASVVTLADTHAGSSPRAWGTPFRAAAADYVDRFIPTRVGNANGSAE